MYLYGVDKQDSKLKIAAEVGCNHKGQLDIAIEMIKVAAFFCAVDVVKFQKRTPKELLTPEEYNAPHPVQHNSYGSTYGEHREFLELSIGDHKRLKEYCEENGLIYSTSVWDMTAAREIVSIKPDHIKIPSAINTNINVLGYLCSEFEGLIHVSLGMTTRAEEEAIVKFFEDKSRNDDLVLYSCTSGYPVSPEDVCLMEIQRIKDKYKNTVRDIGFSGHHNGIAIDIAALPLGAIWFERHFTLNRTWKGTDHAASLEPEGMRRLARNLRATEKALRYKDKEILDVEEIQRKKLKWFAR